MSATGLGTETGIRPVTVITGTATTGTARPEPGPTVSVEPTAVGPSAFDPPAVDWLAVSLVLLGSTFFTGVLLAPEYQALPEHAVVSLYDLRQASGLAFFAKLHHALGYLALLGLGLHLLQAAVRGAYRGGFRRIWWVGILLLTSVVALALSGRMLAWDGLAQWLVSAAGLGSGASALAWAWSAHSLLLPLFLLLVVG